MTHRIVADDRCPEGSGHLVESKFEDSRVEVIFHAYNLGAGGAMKTGYQRAKELEADVILKIDGDGQMDATKISEMAHLLIENEGDYIKGNQFFDIEMIRNMPKSRIFGNLILSFFAKFPTGYWNIFDLNSVDTAISSTALSKVQLYKVDNRSFFNVFR